MTHHGATLFLLIHIAVKGTAIHEVRRFSVTEDFEPGGKLVYFPQLDFNSRTAIEQTWVRLDGAHNPNFDPLNSRFLLVRCYQLLGASGWENYVLIFQCGGNRRIHNHPPAPLMVCHLSKEPRTDSASSRHTVMVAPNCIVGEFPFDYNNLDGNWRKAVMAQLVHANRFEEDISKHPWALKRMFRNRPPPPNRLTLDELSVVLEWQECQPTDPDHNLTPILAANRSSSSFNEENAAALPAYTPI